MKEKIPFLRDGVKLEDLDEKLLRVKVSPESACEELGGRLEEDADSGTSYCVLRRFKHPDKPEVIVSPLEILRQRPAKPAL